MSMAFYCCAPAGKLATKSFFKLKTVPTDCEKTSLDELDNVERYFNLGTAFSRWLGVRVYEPERLENGEEVWHETHQPS